jgi:DnaD/phage-associated family protein
MAGPALGQEAIPGETFLGFPGRAAATIIPSLFFVQVLPRIKDDAELRTTLYVFYALGRRKGYPHFVTLRELQGEAPLLAALDGEEEVARQRLDEGLGLAVGRGTLLRLDVEEAGEREALFFLNTPAGQRAVEMVRGGQLALGRPLPPVSSPPAAERANAFRLYEEHVGPLTPLVAEELLEAERLYPWEWLADAFREAAHLNKRSWRYISRILQRWASEGRQLETTGRATDPDRALREAVRRRVRRA